MLIIGATLSVFVACIPYDFYRYRKRKKAVRKHQERLSLMTRIAPGHAKMMTEIVPAEQRLPAGQRRFGFRSLIKAFRCVSVSAALLSLIMFKTKFSSCYHHHLDHILDLSLMAVFTANVFRFEQLFSYELCKTF